LLVWLRWTGRRAFLRLGEEARQQLPDLLWGLLLEEMPAVRERGGHGLWEVALDARHGVGHVGQELIARPVDDAYRHPELVQAPSRLGEALQLELDPGGRKGASRLLGPERLAHGLQHLVRQAGLVDEPAPHDGLQAAPDPVASLRAGFAAWLRMALDPGVQRIALLDAPAVVGWTRWREIDEQHILGGLRASMRRIAKEGRLPPGDVDLLTHMLLAAVNEAALLIARAEDPQAALQTGQAAVDALIDRLIADPPRRQGDPHRR